MKYEGGFYASGARKSGWTSGPSDVGRFSDRSFYHIVPLRSGLFGDRRSFLVSNRLLDDLCRLFRNAGGGSSRLCRLSLPLAEDGGPAGRNLPYGGRVDPRRPLFRRPAGSRLGNHQTEEIEEGEDRTS